MQDLVESLCHSPSTIKNIYSNTGAYGSSVNHPDLLSNISSATGERTEVSYLTTPLYKDQNNTIYNPNLPLVFNTVRQLVKNDGFGNYSTTTYRYSDGEYYFGDPRIRKFAGFASTTKTNSIGNVAKTYYHLGNGSLSSIGEYNDAFSKIGKPYRVEIKDPAGNLYSKTINKWENVDLGDERDFVKLTQTIDFAYDGDADHREVGATYAYDDDTGNLTEKVEYGEVTGSDNGTFTDTGTDKRTNTLTYAASTTLHVLGLPARNLLVNQASTTVSDTKHYYDTFSLGNVSDGNETKTEFWKSGSNYASATKSYNFYGLPTQQTDGRGNTTTFTYDSLNLYVATTTNALSQETGYHYDYSLGKPKSVIDPNSRVFETVYDGLDRPVTEKQPDLTNPDTLVTKKTYAYTDTQGSRKVVETNYLDGSTDFTLYTYLDGMDRTIQTRREAETTNQFAVRDFVYNNVGLLQKESLPYFSNGSSRTTATATSSLYTMYAYDALGRATSTATAVGTTTQAYDDWTTTITDANGNIKKLTNDAYSRLATVVEKNGTTYATTTNAWHANDTLATTSDADGNVRNFIYDGRGLRLTAEDLHDTGDGTFGTWTYAYDDAGNLSSFVDPKSQTVNFTYDSLNRVVTENYTGQSGTEIEYGYDACTNGKTRLCSATSTGGVATTSYNALGLVATSSVAIDGSYYTTAHQYDRQGNPTSIVYPDNAQVQYSYNTAGLAETVQQKESGGAFADVVSDLDYGPHGQVTYKLFGNGVESTYTFDATQLYRLQNILTIAPEGEEFGFGGGESLELAFNPALHPLALAILDSPEMPEHVQEVLDNAIRHDRPTRNIPDSDNTPAPPPQEPPSDEVGTEPLTGAPDTTPEPTEDETPAEEPASEAPSSENETGPGTGRPAPEVPEEEVAKTDELQESATVRDMLEGKTAAERADIKAAEIAKIGPIVRTTRCQPPSGTAPLATRGIAPSIG